MKNVQIPFELFRDVAAYFNFGAGAEDESPQAERIRKGLQEKMDAAQRRNQYSQGLEARWQQLQHLKENH